MKYLSIDIHYSMSVKILSKLYKAIPVRIENYAFPICLSTCEFIKDSSITRAQEAWVVRRKDVRRIDGQKKKRVNVFKVMYLRCTTEPLSNDRDDVR